MSKILHKNYKKKRKEKTMILAGNVISGLGTAKMWVKKIEDVFQKKLDMKLFPGTLNIKLKEGYTVVPDIIIKPNEFGGTQNVLIQTCNIRDEKNQFVHKAFIVRAEKNANNMGDHNTDIVEIVSDINFREKLNLKDNDIISIEI